ncbi:hypothetical protein BP6252_02165 [Coleophoma cylindrospora]|uniref:Uncharacterized protein n=1 Tax=Coleophoma cylindrospora TaxID=1849047 RepID=A0A3D8SE13_9HELO|nr:hypothetical protein BP6252_02165 [Coleophoma cylindrospora]
MADDDMEISSEHGQQPTGTEDIDIDIDLTTGPNDEDYILEDAQSNAELPDSFQAQPSPAMNDDLMVDEENASYTMGDDILDDNEDEHMEHETIAMAFSVIDHDGNETGEITSYDAQHFHTQTTADNAEAMWDHPAEMQETVEADLVEATETEIQQEPEESTHELQIPWANAEDIMDNHEQMVGTKTAQDDVLDDPEKLDDVEDAVEGQNGTESSTKASLELQDVKLPSQSPHSSNSQVPQIIDERGEAGSSSEVQGAEEELQVDVVTPTATDDEIVPEQNFDNPISNAGFVASIPAAQKVVVIYQTMEYALFSTSDSEDPDSFFLSDMSVCDKSIAELFAALREIIVEDLADEDELCMTIEDLSLEMDEVSDYWSPGAFASQLADDSQTSASIKNVTLQEIVNLRESLLKNDGIQTPEPLVILLGNRPNFTARLATLSSAAAAGKGLTEFQAWEDHSEYQGEASEFEDGKYDNMSQEGDEPQLAAEAENLENKDEVNVEDKATSTNEVEEPSITEYIDSVANKEEATVADENTLTIEPSGETTDVVTDGTAQLNEPAQTEEDEENDLIDYEDELEASQIDQDADQSQPVAATHVGTELAGNSTILFSPCYKPTTCFCTTCDVCLSTEYEAINEQLRRSPLSHLQDKSLHEICDTATNTDHIEENNAVEESNGNAADSDNNFDKQNYERDEHLEGSMGNEHPDVHHPDDEQPDNEQLDSEQPGNDQLGNEQPDDEQPDNEQPDNEQPDNEQPDNEQPDNEQPDNEQPDHEQPENEQLGNEQPDNEQQDNEQPDYQQPDSQQQDNEKPESEHPAISKDVEQQAESESLIEINAGEEHEFGQNASTTHQISASKDGASKEELITREEVYDDNFLFSNEDEVRDSTSNLREVDNDLEISQMENRSSDQDHAAIKESISNTSSLGSADTAESESVTVASANTLEPDEINYEEIDENLYDDLESAVLERKDSLFTNADEEDQDEIDYDDEEEDPIQQPDAAPIPDEPSLPLYSGSAKRPRADADVEDAMAFGSSEAKRIRS